MTDGTDNVLELAAQIVSAHVAHNSVAADELPKLISDVHRALSEVGRPAPETPQVQPSVPIKRSVLADHLVCIDCGKKLSMLKRHIATHHQLTLAQYRQKWGLSPSYPLTAPDYAKTRSRLAKKIGLGRKAAPRKKAAGKSGR